MINLVSTIDFTAACIMFFRVVFSPEAKMMKTTLALACLVLLTLSACSNTAYGLKRDGQQASSALDDASHKVLTTSGKK